MSKYLFKYMCMWPCIWTLLILFNPFLSASPACPHANALSTVCHLSSDRETEDPGLSSVYTVLSCNDDVVMLKEVPLNIKVSVNLRSLIFMIRAFYNSDMTSRIVFIYVSVKIKCSKFFVCLFVF